MNRLSELLLLLPTLVALGACGSGGNGDGGAAEAGGGSPVSSDVALRFSDAPLDALSKVVVTVERITFRREVDDAERVDVDGTDTDERITTDSGAGAEAEADARGSSVIVVERFTSEELGIVDAETFTIDLLAVQGDASRLVLDSVVLPVGRYTDLRLDIVDEDINFSYVEESEGSALKTLKVPSGELKLGAFEVAPLSTQTFVVEFGLRQSMSYNPGPDRYILKPRGVRIVQLEWSAALEGVVDVAALNAEPPCDIKPDPSAGNVVYLYPGHALAPAALADDFDASLAGSAGNGRIAPIASAALAADGGFVLAYLEPGDYTLAASCEAANDDADALDSITVPSPAARLLETTLVRGERRLCSFDGDTPGCVPLASPE